MRIGINASAVGQPEFTGIGHYTRNLLRELARIDAVNEYKVYGPRLDKKDLAIENPNFDIVSMPEPVKLKSIWYSWYLWHYTFFPLQLGRLDCFLSTMPALPLYCPCPRVVVIHDLIPLVLPGAHAARFELTFRSEVSHAVKYADRIVADSESTRRDLETYFPGSAGKTTVIYPGYDSASFLPVADPARFAEVREKYGIPEKYLLFIGILVPRKNVDGLIRAYLVLKQERHLEHKLVIAGPQGWQHGDTYRLVKELGLEQDVLFTGYVANEYVPALLSNAAGFVYPSLYEGFGIPPLEAMACGTPVIVSSASSLPEVVGDAGLVVDPHNVKDIADAIYRVVSDQDLAAQMRQKGLARARLFAWENAAAEMLHVLESTARGDSL